MTEKTVRPRSVLRRTIAAASSAQRAPPPAMRVRNVHDRAEIAVELLYPRQGERIRERREFRLRKTLRYEEQQSGVSVSVPLSVTSAGTRPFGFIARYSELLWACEPKSTGTASYGAPASSSAMCVASAQVPGA